MVGMTVGGIRVGRDFGDRIEVLDGVKENIKIVMNPTDDLTEGLRVQVNAPSKPKLNPVPAIPARSGTPAVAAK